MILAKVNGQSTLSFTKNVNIKFAALDDNKTINMLDFPAGQ